MEILNFILWPIIVVMGLILNWLHHFFGSYGVAIILLSALVRLVTLPLSNIGREHVERERLVQLQMQPALAEAKARYSGRERFEQIEAIYAKHQYHPMHSMASLLPLLGGVDGFDQDEAGGESDDGREVPLRLLAA